MGKCKFCGDVFESSNTDERLCDRCKNLDIKLHPAIAALAVKNIDMDKFLNTLLEQGEVEKARGLAYQRAVSFVLDMEPSEDEILNATSDYQIGFLDGEQAAVSALMKHMYDNAKYMGLNVEDDEE